MDNKKIKIIDTNNKEKHGSNRCPQCGASDITYNIKKGKLICNYCFTEFDSHEVAGIEKNINNLKGETRTTGTKDITSDNDIVTLKCSGCGAEVVINTKEAVNARCHWCRSILSINSQIDNGAVPDVVLPFKLEKKQAEEKIEAFVKKRRFYSNNKFKKEFKSENVMGVYFPYMLVDANCHGEYTGRAGHVAREYEIVTGKDSDGKEKKETVYDIDLYQIERNFDITINNLSIESNKDKLNKTNKDKTTNVINAIMPFDTENCIKYEANYLVGYTSEKRDINIGDIEEKVDAQIKDITRYSLNDDLKYYDSGVDWQDERLEIKGKQWISAYFPVWLYSYQDEKNILHYVVVNARTGETMGSIPLNKTKLGIISIIIDLIIFAIIFALSYNSSSKEIMFLYLLLIVGPIYFCTKSNKYRNKHARHAYELETKNTLKINNRKDDKIRTLREESFRTLTGANNYIINGEKISIKEKIPKE